MGEKDPLRQFHELVHGLEEARADLERIDELLEKSLERLRDLSEDERREFVELFGRWGGGLS